MVGDGNFWDQTQNETKAATVTPNTSSFESVESIETVIPVSDINPKSSELNVPDGFIPHGPREIVSSVIAQTAVAIVLGAVLFVAIGLGSVDEFFNVFPMECDGELIELDDGTYICHSDSYRYNTAYSFFENSTVSATIFDGVDGFDYIDTLRWEHSDNFSVLGYLDPNWDEWSTWRHCEWEGGSFAGETRWYCSYSVNYFEEAFAYCEPSGSLWICTDQYRISESNRYSSEEKSYTNDLTHSCYKAIPLSELSNQTLSDIELKFFQQSYPSWCDGRAILSPEVTSNDTQLPFDGEAFLLFYDDLYFEIQNNADVMQYSSSGVTLSSVMFEIFDENGREIIDAEMQMVGISIIVFMGLLYILGVYAAYTRKTFIAHLGSENTVVVKSTWFNKTAKEKGRIHLMPTSYLREYITYSTDSEGNSSSSTNYEICTPDQPSLSIPSGFSRQKLVEVTGLPVRRDY
jgi:hypothetical protein